jgi:hypothetical protein
MKISWRKWLPFQGWRSVGMTKSADEVPNKLPRNGAVLVGSASQLKWIVFDCPCRRGHRIMLNTDPHRRPTWQVADGSNKRLTITPSVDYQGDDLHCHYFIRGGKVLWAEDSDR